MKGDNAWQSLVSHIAVNPLADSFLLKTLQGVCRSERVTLSDDALTSIMRSANGDLRNALHTLQFSGAGLRAATAAPAARGSKAGSKRKNGAAGAAAAKGGGAGPSAVGGPSSAGSASERDHFPDIFHTVGAILSRPSKRAKLAAQVRSSRSRRPCRRPCRLPCRLPCRHPPPPSLCGRQAERAEQEQREPQRFFDDPSPDPEPAPGPGPAALGALPAAQRGAELDAAFAPEALIASSALEEGSAAAFLHQNYLEGFTEIEDVADAAHDLSDAAHVLDAQRRAPWHSALAPYVACVAGRGVVTRNRAPAPPRFAQTRKPALYGVEREALERKRRATASFNPLSAGHGGGELDGQSLASLGLVGSGELTAEIIPFLRLIVAPTCIRPGQPAHAGPQLTEPQWESVAELCALSGANGQLLRPQRAWAPPPDARASGRAQWGSASVVAGAAEEIDEIEDDDD